MSYFILYFIFVLFIFLYFYLSFLKFNINSTVLFNYYYYYYFQFFYIFIFIFLITINNLFFITFFMNNNLSFNLVLVLNNILLVYIFPFIFIFIFITFISLIFCFHYNYKESQLFFIYCFSILFFGFILFFVDSLLYFILIYEFFLLPSFFILYKFAKTRRSIEAAYLMFFWTQFGALFLLIGFFYLFLLTNSDNWLIISLFCFNSFDINFCFVCFLISFGVKFPIWPFYSWLPKAHVEASTNFSIFLSGVLVKFAFFFFYKCLLILKFESTYIYVYPFLIIGIIDVICKFFYQFDIKKIIAYSTVLEMHWLALCFLNNYSILLISGFCMLISHAFLSTNFFLLVDSITRRYKTRLIYEIHSISFLTPKLFLTILITLLIFLGIPGSLFFVAEFLFFSFLIDLSPIIFLILLSILYLLMPLLFLKNWWLILFGSSNNFYNSLKNDILIYEFYLINFINVLLFWFGFFWQFLLFNSNITTTFKIL